MGAGNGYVFDGITHIVTWYDSNTFPFFANVWKTLMIQII